MGDSLILWIADDTARTTELDRVALKELLDTYVTTHRFVSARLLEPILVSNAATRHIAPKAAHEWLKAAIARDRKQ